LEGEVTKYADQFIYRTLPSLACSVICSTTRFLKPEVIGLPESWLLERGRCLLLVGRRRAGLMFKAKKVDVCDSCGLSCLSQEFTMGGAAIIGDGKSKSLHGRANLGALNIKKRARTQIGAGIGALFNLVQSK
jgi:hypothetical protein